MSQERLRSVVSFSVGSMENTSENSTCKTNTQMRSCITMTYIGLRSMLWSVLYYIYVFVCFSECHDSTDRFKVRVWYFVFSSQTVHRKRSIAKIILWWVGRGKRLRSCVPTDWIVHVPVTHFWNWPKPRHCLYNIDRWKRNSSKCCWIKKQIEPFHIHPSKHW